METANLRANIFKVIRAAVSSCLLVIIGLFKYECVWQMTRHESNENEKLQLAVTIKVVGNEFFD